MVNWSTFYLSSFLYWICPGVVLVCEPTPPLPPVLSLSDCLWKRIYIMARASPSLLDPLVDGNYNLVSNVNKLVPYWNAKVFFPGLRSAPKKVKSRKLIWSFLLKKPVKTKMENYLFCSTSSLLLDGFDWHWHYQASVQLPHSVWSINLCNI